MRASDATGTRRCVARSMCAIIRPRLRLVSLGRRGVLSGDEVDSDDWGDGGGGE